jgi:hypothetical protein
MNATANTAFLVRKAVPLPPRTIPNAGPRTTKYPLDSMEPGDAFGISVESEKQARQRQSQFSALAKARKIKLSTRYFAEANEVTEALGVTAPALGVWHMGEATEDEAGAEDENGAAVEASQDDNDIEL